jgi:hypothetical protein
MPDKIGTLCMQPTGRWAVCLPGRVPAEITSGDLFRIEVDGVLRITRMEYEQDGSGGEFYCIDGFELRDGVRAAIGSGD